MRSNDAGANPSPAGELAGEVRRGLNQLAILYLLESESYGYELTRRLAEQGLEVDEGSLYPILRRLEASGLLRSRWDTGHERPRRYYVITDGGREARERLAGLWRQLRGTLDRLVGVEESAAPEAPDPELEAERAALSAQRQEVERLRSDLLSTVSHELRTPLTLVRTSVGRSSVRASATRWRYPTRRAAGGSGS